MKMTFDIVMKPVISEKSFAEAKADKYTFLVKKGATKNDIKLAVEKMFNVNVEKVYTANIKGTKTRNTRKGKQVLNASYKKARVQVKKGQKISIFEEKTK